ncbi:3-phosphoshikimate 1-carboxyvinyltransferase [Candidatus Aerophobetes bacterium]|nr:3-phosphoshikimate 1-carboxyvinyltransferase [Candidatus Aerophobetes bacterium]
MQERRQGVLKIKPCRFLEGKITLPGDKSISHRAVILSSIARGVSSIKGIQKGKDCFATIECLKKLGARIKEKEDILIIEGEGLFGLREADDVLNCQNSGTTMRILSGILAAQEFYTVLTGDDSLRKRPMERIIHPLSLMGANIWARKGFFAPLSIKGGSLKPINYSMQIASAQVKSSVLLAALYAPGLTRIKEPHPSRDHTERMLEYMGVRIEKKDSGEVAIWGEQEPQARSFFIPGDISAAAFFLGAAAILPGSRVQIDNVGINPTRCGFIKVLEEMGAEVEVFSRKVVCNEEVASIKVEGKKKLKGVRIKGEIIPSMIDEIPVLAVVACFAEGETLIEGASELRVKETDRIRALCRELGKMGAKIKEKPDGMIIQGTGKLRGAEVDSWQDHRIAMALTVAALCAEGESFIRGADCVDISFPDFYEKLKEITR